MGKIIRYRRRLPWEKTGRRSPGEPPAWQAGGKNWSRKRRGLDSVKMALMVVIVGAVGGLGVQAIHNPGQIGELRSTEPTSKRTRVVVAQADPSSPMEVAGAARVVDGDTLEIGAQVIRIHGIDAPEASQTCQLPKGTWDCSTAAVNLLRAMIEGKEVRCAGHEFDQYERLIARCATDEVPDIGAQLVTAGLAWAFIKYSNDYIGVEKGPRAKKIGVWQSKTQPPWEYRARRWETAAKSTSADGDCPIKGNINAKGERIYHAPWSKHYAKTQIDTLKGERWFCTEAEARAAGWRAPYR